MRVYGRADCGAYVGPDPSVGQLRGLLGELVRGLDEEAARDLVEAPDLEAVALAADVAVGVLGQATEPGLRWGWRPDGSLWLEPEA